jgi:hypothetical protein
MDPAISGSLSTTMEARSGGQGVASSNLASPTSERPCRNTLATVTLSLHRHLQPVGSNLTAPSRNSASNFLRFSGMTLLIVDASTLRGELHSHQLPAIVTDHRGHVERQRVIYSGRYRLIHVTNDPPRTHNHPPGPPHDEPSISATRVISGSQSVGEPFPSHIPIPGRRATRPSAII